MEVVMEVVMEVETTIETTMETTMEVETTMSGFIRCVDKFIIGRNSNVVRRRHVFANYMFRVAIDIQKLLENTNESLIYRGCTLNHSVSIVRK